MFGQFYLHKMSRNKAKFQKEFEYSGYVPFVGVPTQLKMFLSIDGSRAWVLFSEFYTKKKVAGPTTQPLNIARPPPSMTEWHFPPTIELGKELPTWLECSILKDIAPSAWYKVPFFSLTGCWAAEIRISFFICTNITYELRSGFRGQTVPCDSITALNLPLVGVISWYHGARTFAVIPTAVKCVEKPLGLTHHIRVRKWEVIAGNLKLSRLSKFTDVILLTMLDKIPTWTRNKPFGSWSNEHYLGGTGLNKTKHQWIRVTVETVSISTPAVCRGCVLWHSWMFCGTQRCDGFKFLTQSSPLLRHVVCSASCSVGCKTVPVAFTPTLVPCKSLVVNLATGPYAKRCVTFDAGIATVCERIHIATALYTFSVSVPYFLVHWKVVVRRVVSLSVSLSLSLSPALSVSLCLSFSLTIKRSR